MEFPEEEEAIIEHTAVAATEEGEDDYGAEKVPRLLNFEEEEDDADDNNDNDSAGRDAMAGRRRMPTVLENDSDTRVTKVTPEEEVEFDEKRKLTKEERDSWRTPPAVFKWLSLRFNFEVDAAATSTNSLCARFFEDGLNTTWADHATLVYCNPPYSQLALWLAKAETESRRGCASVIVIPSHKGELWWHYEIVGHAHEVILFGGRMRFGHPCTGRPLLQAPFGSSAIVYLANTDGGRVNTILQSVLMTEHINKKLVSMEEIKRPTVRPSRPESTRRKKRPPVTEAEQTTPTTKRMHKPTIGK